VNLKDPEITLREEIIDFSEFEKKYYLDENNFEIAI